MTDFTELAQRARSQSVASGFAERGEQLRLRGDAEDLADYNSNRITLIIGECIEAHEELRKGHSATHRYWKDGKPEGVPVELADVVIRAMDTAMEWGIDLEAEVKAKLDFNLTRAYKHGGKAF